MVTRRQHREVAAGRVPWTPRPIDIAQIRSWANCTAREFRRQRRQQVRDHWEHVARLEAAIEAELSDSDRSAIHEIGEHGEIVSTVYY